MGNHGGHESIVNAKVKSPFVSRQGLKCCTKRHDATHCKWKFVAIVHKSLAKFEPTIGVGQGNCFATLHLLHCHRKKFENVTRNWHIFSHSQRCLIIGNEIMGEILKKVDKPHREQPVRYRI